MYLARIPVEKNSIINKRLLYYQEEVKEKQRCIDYDGIDIKIKSGSEFKLKLAILDGAKR